jgi:hypothetical protein
MPQVDVKRKTDRLNAVRSRRNTFSGSGPAKSVPYDIRALADDIVAAQYNCSPHTEAEREAGRRLLARGIPRAELAYDDPTRWR